MPRTSAFALFGTLLGLLACALPIPIGGGLSQQQAADLVLEQVVTPEALEREVIVFAWPEALGSEDELIAFAPDGYTPIPQPVEIDANAWFFWIDDAPGARFVHPSRFVLVDQASGELVVTNEAWWPVLNGANLWLEDAEYWDEANWAFSNVEWRPADLSDTSSAPDSPGRLAAPRAADGAGRNGPRTQGERNPLQAIVISGEGNSDKESDQLAVDSSNMLGVLQQSGFDTTYLGPERDEIGDLADRKAPNDDTSLSTAFQQFRGSLEPGDTLVVYLTGHGYVREDGEGEAAGISEGELEIWLGGLPDVNIILIIDACESGSFSDTASEYADVTITATNAQDPTWFDRDDSNDPNPEDTGSEFTSGLVQRWREIMGNPVEIARVQVKSAQRAGDDINFWEALVGEAYLGAVQLDAGYLNGLSFPMLVPGRPSTRSTAAEPIRFPDSANDGISCHSGVPLNGETPPQIDIGSVLVGVEDPGQMTFTIEFPRMDALTEPFVGSIEFDDPAVANSDPSSTWYFSGRGEYDLNFIVTPGEPVETDAYGFTPGEGWLEDPAMTFSAHEDGNALILTIPIEGLPPLQGADSSAVRFWVGAVTPDFENCDAAPWNGDDMGAGFLPATQFNGPNPSGPGISMTFSDAVGDAVVCGPNGEASTPANDPQVDISSLHAVWLDELWQFAIGMEAPLDPESYSYAVQLFLLSQLEGADRVLQWEQHAEVFTIGEIDAQTGELLQDANGSIIIENNLETGWLEFSLPPSPSTVAIGVRSFYTATEGSELACDVTSAFDIPAEAQTSP